MSNPMSGPPPAMESYGYPNPYLFLSTKNPYVVFLVRMLKMLSENIFLSTILHEMIIFLWFEWRFGYPGMEPVPYGYEEEKKKKKKSKKDKKKKVKTPQNNYFYCFFTSFVNVFM